MAYSDKVIDHYSNPKNVGTLDKSKSNVGTGLVGAPECGDVMRLQIKVYYNRRKIQNIWLWKCDCRIFVSNGVVERYDIRRSN